MTDFACWKAREKGLFKKSLFLGAPLSEGVYIELRDGKRLLAEGIDSLLEYGDTRVTVGAGTQRIVFAGNGLEMTFLSENRIMLEGTIREVRYET